MLLRAVKISMGAQRYLCSELVFLEYAETRAVVNLEEIWTTGAVIECETAIEAGTRFRLRTGNRSFSGTAVLIEPHEFGCRVEVEFSPMTLWKREEYSPHHLLDPSTLGAGGAS
jgi:hypothetical protein